MAGDWLVYVLMQGKFAYSPRSLNKHRRDSSSVTLGKFNITLLEEIASVQKRMRDEFQFDDMHKKKAVEYLGELYEQFGLVTDDEPSVEENCKLRIYL